MKYKVLTLAREYGSGGAEIAGLVAQKLGWKLLDRDLIYKIAGRAGVDADVARACDEHVDSWLHRITKPLWQGDVAAAVTLAPMDLFDAESMSRFTNEVIEEACSAGNCVIVGRGAQCVLEGRESVFHVFIYAPFAARVCRIQRRLETKDTVEHLIRETDMERSSYVRLYFGRNWADPHLYDMMINSRLGCEAVASQIVAALRGGS